jgi:hypothetical protein
MSVLETQVVKMVDGYNWLRHWQSGSFRLTSAAQVR